MIKTSDEKKQRRMLSGMRFRLPLYIAIRWSITGKKSAHSSGLKFASLGIAVGVIALIVVLSVMNGLQLQYIESLLETTSFHIRARIEESNVDIFTDTLRKNRLVKSVTPFIETNLLVQSSEDRQSVLRVMWIDPEDLALDSGYCKALNILPSAAAKSLEEGIILGSEAAQILGVSEGSILTLRGAFVDPEEGIQGYSERVKVSSIFRSGYYELDAAFAIMPRLKAKDLAGFPASTILGIKLINAEKSISFVSMLEQEPGIIDIESWQNYNRSFFSALHTEKILMFLLVGIIFLVVAINIHYSMRRSIARKSRDLAILAAMGMNQHSISSIFMLEGILVGLAGALFGIAIGIPIAQHVDGIINGAIGLIESFISFLYRLGFVKGVPDLRVFSPSIFYIEGIPSRIFISDIAVIAAFALIFPVIAVYLVYRRFRNVSPLEVLRSE